MGHGLLRQAIDGACKAVLIRCLSVTNGNVKLAASNAGVNRTYFYELMRRYGIKVERRVVATVFQKRLRPEPPPTPGLITHRIR